MTASLFSSYTNRATGRTTVMHGVKLCGYVDKVIDADRAVWARGFYYAVSVAKGGEVAASYCEANSLKGNIEHVQREWEAGR